MSLTRRALTAMGIETEKAEEIIKLHTETVDGLKDELAAVKEEIEKLGGVQKELDALKADLGSKYVTKEDHEKTVNEYQEYKNNVAAKEAKAAKEAAARAYFKDKKITDEKNLAVAMRGSVAEIAALELDEKGKIKDSKSLDDLIAGDFAGLVTKDVSARIDTGPALGGGGSQPQHSRAAQLYQQHYEALYGANKGKGEST